jgi:hypothetical protein
LSTPGGRHRVLSVTRIAILAAIAILPASCTGAAPTTTSGPKTTSGPTTTGPAATGPGTSAQGGSVTGPTTSAPELPGLQTRPAPWPSETEHLAQRMALIGMPPLGAEVVTVHIHQNLAVVVHGQDVPVPLIGQTRRGLAEIHTHAEFGTIHVESAAVRHYTLGDVFDVWGVRFTWGSSQAQRCLGSYCDGLEGQIKVFVDGQPFLDDPTQLELANEQVIVVTYGIPDELPDPMPSRFRYERPIFRGAA